MRTSASRNDAPLSSRVQLKHWNTATLTPGYTRYSTSSARESTVELKRASRSARSSAATPMSMAKSLLRTSRAHLQSRDTAQSMCSCCCRITPKVAKCHLQNHRVGTRLRNGDLIGVDAGYFIVQSSNVGCKVGYGAGHTRHR